MSKKDSRVNSSPAGKIFDIKKYAIHDGPGIRTTVFLKGCPLTCGWCHNPEGLWGAPKIIYEFNRCIGCGDCIEACREAAISATPNGMSTNRHRCKGCGVCVDACPGGARELTERTVTVNQLVEIIKQDILFYDESGGGVTFSGGEPLLQADFLIEVLKACGHCEIHRIVDTSGYANRSIIEEVARQTDLFLFDLKLIDSKRHKQFTGVSNQTILDNLAFLHNLEANVTVRIPLIPGINDDHENLSQICSFLLPFKGIRDVHILPYHDYQKNKYGKLGMEYTADDIVAPTPERVSNSLKQFEEKGFQVSIGG